MRDYHVVVNYLYKGRPTHERYVCYNGIAPIPPYTILNHGLLMLKCKPYNFDVKVLPKYYNRTTDFFKCIPHHELVYYNS